MSKENQKTSFVIDTSTFMSNELEIKGDNLDEKINFLLDYMEEAQQEKDFKFYMPSTTKEELIEILRKRGDTSEDTVKRVKTTVIRKNPEKFDIKVSGQMLRNFVGEVRERVDKGLRVSEKAVKELENMDEEPEKEYYTKSDVVISDLRDKYKSTMRKEIMDSKEDIDLVLLAKDTNSFVVSEDRGVLNWADEMGLKIVKGRDFANYLESELD